MVDGADKEWIWSETHGDYYKTRLRSDGSGYDYIWARSTLPEPIPLQPPQQPQVQPPPAQDRFQPGYPPAQPIQPYDRYPPSTTYPYHNTYIPPTHPSHNYPPPSTTAYPSPALTYPQQGPNYVQHPLRSDPYVHTATRTQPTYPYQSSKPSSARMESSWQSEGYPSGSSAAGPNNSQPDQRIRRGKHTVPMNEDYSDHGEDDDEEDTTDNKGGRKKRSTTHHSV
ncbi:hypothetical protein CC78DRAFT_222718 [Lojkania enalia]|uniref:Uncharacterized protein n=1 Tax=Lojkania enalia TaxID=147567 RepID=A0A9P4JXK7_9PLEO|nr:hypothetical protein CC78DRAFT_222718 [Didymosphaeria enalia]